jgi:hypothetical protein
MSSLGDTMHPNFTYSPGRKELNDIIHGAVTSRAIDRIVLSYRKIGFNQIVIEHPNILTDPECDKMVDTWKTTTPEYDARGVLIW